MVKGISRQVIVVQGAEPKLFDQAIFILKDNVQEVTDEGLLKEADRLLRSTGSHPSQSRLLPAAPLWAALGAAVTGLAWLITACVF